MEFFRSKIFHLKSILPNLKLIHILRFIYTKCKPKQTSDKKCQKKSINACAMRKYFSLLSYVLWCLVRWWYSCIWMTLLNVNEGENIVFMLNEIRFCFLCTDENVDFLNFQDEKYRNYMHDFFKRQKMLYVDFWRWLWSNCSLLAIFYNKIAHQNSNLLKKILICSKTYWNKWF